MNLLPYLEYRINSKKFPKDIYNILKSVTDFEKKIFGYTRAKFIGEINPFDFNIVRNINYRNSFNPVIEGSIKIEENISVIDIKMHLDPVTRILSIIWFAIVGFYFLFEVFYSITIKVDMMSLIIPVCFIIFDQLLIKRSFYSEANKSIQILEKLLS